MNSYTARYKEIAEDILGEENLQKLKYMGLTEEQILNLYNNHFNHDQEKFRQAVENMLDNEEVKDLDRNLKDQIQHKVQMIEKLQEIRQGLTIDQIKKHVEQEEK